MRETAVTASVRAAAARAVRPVRRRWRAAGPHQRRTVGVATGAGAVGLAVALTAVSVTGPWDGGQRTAERVRAGARSHTGDGRAQATGPGGLRLPSPAPSAPDVLAALGLAPDGGGSAKGGDDAPPPTGKALAGTLGPLLEDTDLGKVTSVSVLDALSGRRIFASHADRPTTPASTIKLATATAVLSARGADYRIPTRVVAGKGHSVVLVGGGDPTLTLDDLDALAGRTAEALGKAGVRKVSVDYDTSLYSGPLLHPIGPNNNLAPVTPLMINEARLDDSTHGPAPRAADPAAEAAREFAERLAKQGVTVHGERHEVTAPRHADRLAEHRSAPLSALVERMLTNSDNDLAEALARQTALASGEPASFAGDSRAVLARLKKLRLPVAGAHIADGSGLSHADRIPPRLLTHILVLAGDPDRPELRSILTGLPVAAFSGTLAHRYDDSGHGPDFAPGAGLIHAKTGTLTGVNTLAGTVVDADGRLLAFAFMTNGTKDRLAAQDALDHMASTLADCGCH
jgi:D-alanyl-D-alanine carboxypeptidase/D-alanyl-D-alanine-endopeptidase (penicillin-binding protein 4)